MAHILLLVTSVKSVFFALLDGSMNLAGWVKIASAPTTGPGYTDPRTVFVKIILFGLL